MLDILRRHAASYLIKVILGMIIVSFVFFYGWSKIQRSKQLGNPDGEAAKINGNPIPYSEYSFLYEQAANRLGSNIQSSDDKKAIQGVLRSMAINQAIRRHMTLQLAKKSGIQVSDQELASYIQKQFTNEDGVFDKNFYLTKYLPYFRNRYGIDYENLLKQDLLIQITENSFDFLNVPVLPQGEKLKEWVFTVVEFNPNISDKIKDIDEAKSAANKLIREKNMDKWKNIAEKLGGKHLKSQKTTLANRQHLLTGNVEDIIFEKVFSLTSSNKTISEPIVATNKVYVVALEDINEVDQSPMFRPFVQSWLDSELSSADVKIYIDQ